MRKLVLIISLVAVLLLLTGCAAKTIKEIQSEEYIGKTVKVSGEIKNTVKIGSISGYVIADETGQIAVSAKKLPSEGDSRTVSGVLMKDTIFGYYIKSEE